MPDHYQLHPITPQERFLQKAADCLKNGGLALCPTDAGYTFVWNLNAVEAENRVIRLRQLDSKHPFTLLCRTLSEAGRLARLEDSAFRLMRTHCPGPCTFILPASPELPRRLKHSGRSKRREIGVRLPRHAVMNSLLELMGEPLLSTSVVLPEEDDLASHEIQAVIERCLRFVDVLLDAGDCDPGPTSVIDCTSETPEILRQGFHEVSI